jgi:hypothetical protein
MKTFLLCAFCCVIIACSSTATRSGLSEEPKVVVEDALKAEIVCGKSHVEETDDGASDASTVGFALAMRCNGEYVAATEAWGAAYLDNETQRRIFRKKRSGTTERVEAFLPIVMQYRQSLSGNRSK